MAEILINVSTFPPGFWEFANTMNRSRIVRIDGARRCRHVRLVNVIGPERSDSCYLLPFYRNFKAAGFSNHGYCTRTMFSLNSLLSFPSIALSTSSGFLTNVCSLWVTTLKWKMIAKSTHAHKWIRSDCYLMKSKVNGLSSLRLKFTRQPTYQKNNIWWGKSL